MPPGTKPIIVAAERRLGSSQKEKMNANGRSVCAPAGERSQPTLVQGLCRIAAEDNLLFRVAGTCMGSLLTTGSSVKLVLRAHYWPGDVVVTWWPDEGFRIHRVIGVYRKNGIWKLVTQADAAARPDVAVPKSFVVGKVAGGGCHPDVVRVPLEHRLWALWRFVLLILSTLISKKNGLWQFVFDPANGRI
jgi:hypothetical protein